jgi:ABC-type Zn uptake system ZnuABC Zn-binding protein ZnuA
MTTRINRRTIIGAMAAAPVALVSGHAAAQEKISIATSMPILQDIVANIAGEHADVFSILPGNADPHTWEATPDDMVRLSEAHAFIFIGADLEPFVETGGWRRTVQDNDIAELQVTEHVDVIKHEETEEEQGHDDHDHTGVDPHIWLDPLTMVQAVPAIAEFLASVDSANADAYIANGERYAADLEALHTDLEESLGGIPEERRKLLVLHDAYRYFAARYDFEIIGIVLENPDAEISAREVVDLLQVVEESGVNVVFSEPQFNVSELELLNDQGDVQIAVLLTDSFAEGVETYIELMQFNRDQLVTYLGE